MQIKEYAKNVAAALLAPVAKSLYDVNPNWGASFTLIASRAFTWSTSDYVAYNNKIFYTGINILNRKMVEAPITFNKKKVKKDTRKYYSKNITNEERAALKRQALTELEDHELNNLFDSPNSYQSGIEMMEDFWFNYAFGDGYLFFEPIGDELSRNRKPIAVHSLSRTRINAVRSNDRFKKILSYNYTTFNGEQINILPEYILHLKHWNPNISDLYGYGIDHAASMDIALNNAGNQTEGAAFENGGRGTLFSGEAEVTAEGKVVNKMTATQMSSLKDTVEKDMAGVRNNRKLKFTNGKVIVTPYGDTLAEMEVNASEKSRWLNIFAIIGLPQQLAPITEGSSYNNMKEGYKALVSNLVISELKKFDQKLTKCIQQWWTDILCVHDLTEFSELAPDLELMSKVYGKPSLREDERRAIFGYDELGGEEGSAILVPSGLINLKDVISNEFDSLTGREEM